MNIDSRFDKGDVNKIVEILRRISPKRGGKAFVNGLTLATLEVEAGLRIATTTGSPLKSRTGRLSNSIGSRVQTTSVGVQAIIGSGVGRGERVPYAGIHETGGTIRPKNSKYLTIPLKAAKTAGGAPRGKARDFSNTFVLKAKSGQLLIVQKTGKDSLTPLFVLKKSVKVPASRYMSKTLAAKRVRIVDIICKTMEKEIK